MKRTVKRDLGIGILASIFIAGKLGDPVLESALLILLIVVGLWVLYDSLKTEANAIRKASKSKKIGNRGKK
ncbi:MAG: hypothetical protein ABH834_06440 [Candidatus Altiarchaeota archaeon]